MIELGEAFLRIGLAAGVGALIGLERELHGQHAGMRTYALVSAGASLFTLAGAYGFPELSRSPNVDPMRVAAQIVSGIGFIGAGAILRDGGSIRGVTTAAGLWASAAVGMSVGSGQYVLGLVGTGVVLTFLGGLRVVRDRGLASFRAHHEAFDVLYARGHGTMGPIVKAVELAGATLEGLEIQDEDDRRQVRVAARVRDRRQLEERLEEVAALPEVRRIEFVRSASLDAQKAG